MKRRILVIWLLVSLCFTGCGWLDGSYVSVTPHRQQLGGDKTQEGSAANYTQLLAILEEMVSAGEENRVIRVEEFDEEALEDCLVMAAEHISSTFPLGAYAVEDITCEIGTSGGVAAVAVQVSYLHERGELQRIHKVSTMEDVRKLMADALVQCDTSLVMLVDHYEPADMIQLVEDYASAYPSRVMELPGVTSQVYPDYGQQRVVELRMTYQSSREVLRNMQIQVQKIFNSAALYVSGDASEGQKFGQLYAFLMERFSSYQIKTSITPAYSLLNHGVGDSRAFATVYAQMCWEAGMECLVVVGTRNGEPWTWNMIREGEIYYHVDLLACREEGSFRQLLDSEMVNYVWDYSAYPACTLEPTETQPSES